MEDVFTPFFKQYEALAVMADDIFKQVAGKYSDCVACKTECADCCHALFDVTLIEAVYINHHFHRMFSGPEKDHLLEIANVADRSVYRIKRNAHRTLQKGAAETDVLTRMASERVRCPLLDNANLCRLYAYRPITCRLYGIPTSINGAGHTCGRSGFIQGTAYPTVNLDGFHRKLFEISAELVKSLGSRHSQMADLLIPVSMALLTVFDEDYLGLKPVAPAGTDEHRCKTGGSHDLA